MGSWQYGGEIWQKLLYEIGNAEGVAALMGSFVAESNLIPYVRQGYGSNLAYCRQYTAEIDNGTITKSQFVNSNDGYGLAQWTYPTRKAAMYDLAKSSGLSIGSVDLNVAQTMSELRGGYKSTLDFLQSNATLRQKSDYVLHNYESPTDQSEAVELKRYEYAVDVYNTYSGLPPIPPGPGPGPSSGKFKWWIYQKPKWKRMVFYGQR